MHGMFKTARLTPRKSPRQDRARATVDAILEATARILLLDGYHAINTNRVSEVAGVSIGSLYQYFPTKESMVSELYRSRRAQLVTGVGLLADQLDSATAAEVGMSLAEAAIRFHQAEADLFRTLLPRAARIGAFRKASDLDDTAVGLLARLLATNPHLRSHDAHAQAAVLWATVDSVAQKTLFLPDPTSIERAQHELATLIERFLAA